VLCQSQILSKQASWRDCKRQLALGALIGAALFTAVNAIPETAPTTADAAAKDHLDRSGRPRVGIASFYADRFAGRPMADGTPMKPQGNNAASRTLPLGTIARVTNLETGRTAMVTIRDRGPYVKGRIVDLSPFIARQIGIDRKEGLAMVQVTPIEVPAPR
jgi:rare lipoprotein A